MATPFPEKRYKAKYMCFFCEKTWTAKETRHLEMNCINSNCKKLTRSYKFEVIDKLVKYGCKNHCINMMKTMKKCSSEVYEDIPCCPICLDEMKVLNVKDLWPKERKFGHFRCNDCRNEWKSGNAWEGVRQQCRKCGAEILPYLLDPLHFDPERNSKGESHQPDLCEMCKKLGRNCKTYVPPNDNVASTDEIPEDTDTVITTNSSITGVSFTSTDDYHSDDDDSDPTLTNSSDEESDDLFKFDKRFSKLKLNTWNQMTSDEEPYDLFCNATVENLFQPVPGTNKFTVHKTTKSAMHEDCQESLDSSGLVVTLIKDNHMLKDVTVSKDTAHSCWNITYQVKEEGEYQFIITLDGVELDNSPFKRYWYAKPGRGCLVDIGQDWMWEQKEGGYGIVLGYGKDVMVSDNWVKVKWKNGRPDNYRWGAEGGAYDVMIVSSQDDGTSSTIQQSSDKLTNQKQAENEKYCKLLHETHILQSTLDKKDLKLMSVNEEKNELLKKLGEKEEESRLRKELTEMKETKDKITLDEDEIHSKWEDLTSVMKEKIYKGLLQEVETLKTQQSENEKYSTNLLHETQSKLDKKDLELMSVNEEKNELSKKLGEKIEEESKLKKELTEMKETKAKDKITLGEEEINDGGKRQDRASILEKMYNGLLKELETLRAQQLANKKFLPLNAVDEGVQFDYWVPMEDLLHGAKIVDERVFNVQGSGEQFFDWSECGFTLQVPEGALLGTETCAVAVKALVAGNFQFPTNTQLISGLYAISAARVFRKPVLTTIQHCLRVERKNQINRMCFIKAHQTHKGMPYVFRKEEGGDFEVGSQYGSFWQYSFSNLGIALENQNQPVPVDDDGGDPSDEDTEQDGGEIQQEDEEEEEIENEDINEDDPPIDNENDDQLPSLDTTRDSEIDESSNTSGVGTSSINEGTSSIAEDDGTQDDSNLNDSQSVTTSSSDDCFCYYALTYYEHKTSRVNSYVHRFIAVKNLNSHIKYVKTQPSISSMEASKSFQFSFAYSNEIIELEFSSIFVGTEGNGWHIEPDCSPSQISKKEVDSLGQELQIRGPDTTHVYPALPMCSTDVYADRGTSCNLRYPVPVKGMKQAMTLHIQRQINDHQTAVLPSPSDGLTIPCSTTSTTTTQPITADTSSCVKDKDLDRLKRIVTDVLTKNVDNLTSALKSSMDNFATKLLAENLIAHAAKDHFSYSVFIDSFLVILKIMQDIKDIECHCSTLLKILNEIGGPPSFAAQLLKKQLIDKVKCELHADFCV